MSKCIKVEALGIGYANPDVFENKAYAEGWNSAVKIIKEAEIIDAEPVRHGRWEEAIRTRRSKAGKIEDFRCYECSACSKSSFYKTNYCSYCGAKMDEECEK